MPGPISWGIQGYSPVNGVTRGPSTIDQPPVLSAGFTDMSMQPATVLPPSFFVQEHGIGPCPNCIPLPDQSYNDLCALPTAMLLPTAMHQPSMIPEHTMMLQPSDSYQQHGPDPDFNHMSKPPSEAVSGRFGHGNLVSRGVAEGPTQVLENSCCSIATTAKGHQVGSEESLQEHPYFFQTEPNRQSLASLLGVGPQGGQYANGLPSVSTHGVNNSNPFPSTHMKAAIQKHCCGVVPAISLCSLWEI